MNKVINGSYLNLLLKMTSYITLNLDIYSLISSRCRLMILSLIIYYKEVPRFFNLGQFFFVRK